MAELALPVWIPSAHPLYLNREIRRRIRREFHPRSVFLNIPYSERFRNLEVAILSTVTAYGLRPRMARERNRLEVRLQKIFELILSCPLGINDLSYSSRLNMPLELGLMLALGKESFVMSGRRYAALRHISDLNFCDIHYHEGRVRNLIVGLSRWIEQNASRKRLRTDTLMERYRRFQRIRKKLGEDFDRIRPDEIVALLPITRDEYKYILQPGE